MANQMLYYISSIFFLILTSNLKLLPLFNFLPIYIWLLEVKQALLQIRGSVSFIWYLPLHQMFAFLLDGLYERVSDLIDQLMDKSMWLSYQLLKVRSTLELISSLFLVAVPQLSKWYTG